MLAGLSISNASPKKLPGPQLLHHLVPRHGNDGVPAIDHADEHGASTTLTYSEFHDSADALARHIASVVERATPSSRRFIVPVLIPQGPDLYISQLAILKAGGAFCPIVLDAPEERLRFILQDVDACILLTTAATRTQLPNLEGIDIISVDDISTQDRGSELQCSVSPTDPAYIMYTSGSTGQPKGVILSHSAATQALLAHDLHIPTFRRFLQFASPTFDVSVFEIFFPWLRGSTLVSCDRRRMLNDLPATITDLNVDACELTPSVASSLLRGRQSVPTLKVLLTIGEMLKPSVVEEFGGDNSESAVLHGMYGPTEATIHCTLQTHFPKSLSCASIGCPLETVSAFVVRPSDDQGRQHDAVPKILPMGEEGELAVGGHQLADGYLNREEQTKAAFVRHPQHGILYRTGDRARMLPDGSLECLGRISSGQVKLRGQRIELGEIEHAVSRTPGCRDAVAEVIGGILVAFCVRGDEHITASHVSETCRKWLPAFMAPGDIVLLDSLPYLASGKCDRKTLKANYEQRQTSHDSDDGIEHPYLENVLSAIKSILQCEVKPNSALPSLGLDSLSSIRMASELKKRGLAQVDAGRLLAAQTPLEICSLLEVSDRSDTAPPWQSEAETAYKPTVEEQLRKALSPEDLSDLDQAFPCTAVQVAMLSETARNPEAYCNWVEFVLPGLDNLATVSDAIVKLSELHPLLRAGFFATSGCPWTYISTIWKSLEGNQILKVADFDRQFRIETDKDLLRPLRFQLLHTQSGCRILLQAHHALFDQWSIDVLRADLAAILKGRHCDEPTSFKAVSDYHVAQYHSNVSATATEFWQEHLRDVTVTALPVLREQHVARNLQRTPWHTTSVQSTQLKAQSRNLGCSNPAVFQAALALVLGSYTGATDVTFGTVLSGRTIPVQGVDTVFGPCLATLPSRVDYGTTRTSRDLLRAVTNSSRSMQDAALVSPTAIRQAAGVAPGTALFDTLFVWQETTLDSTEFAQTVVEVDSQDQLEFNLVLEFEPAAETLRVRATYQESLLDLPQVNMLLHQIEVIAMALIDEPEGAISAIDARLPATALSIANPKPAKYSHTFEITSAVEQRAIDSPDSVAILFATDLASSPPATTSISYSELEARANRMARHFIAAGLEPGGLVCICMEKCIDLYVAMLATFKCGSGYLPLVPETPSVRISSILAQADINLCVCDAETSLAFRQLTNVKIVDLSSARLPEDSSSVETIHDGSRVSYAVFTSGSTGEPKGVAVTMDNLKGNLAVLGELYAVSPGDRLLQSCSQAFDVSVFEIFFAFYSGMCLCSATKDVMFHDFEQSIRAFRATHLSLTPTVAALVDPSNTPDVRFLVTAGEGITEKVHRAWAGHGLHQGYGPSETTNICSVNMNVSPDDVIGNIGPPFRNTSAFVIAPEGPFRILPAGAYGEFAFGGEQVFKGYIGREDLNAEKIIAHPEYGRVYRSGDMGRILSNGTLLISGRLDDQVKIRGNRVELGEINAIASDYDKVTDCTTLLLGDKSSNQMLATFWVPKSSEPSTTCSLAMTAADETPDLFRHLEASLPAYMIPSTLIPMTSLPVTAQGKLDKRKLRSIIEGIDSGLKEKLSRSYDGFNNDPPSTATERIMAEILAEMLSIPVQSISRNASFFALGLNSLNAIQFARSLSKKTDKRFGIAQVMRHSSIARLSALVSENPDPQKVGKHVDVRQLLEQDLIKGTVTAYAEKGLAVDSVLPCTPLQEAMLSASASSKSNSYFNTTRINVRGNMAKVLDCWSEVTRRHAILRTSFVETSSADHPYVQVVLSDPRLPQFSADYGLPRQQANGHANGLSNGNTKDSYGSETPAPSISLHAPLRIEVQGSSLCLHMHHALYDGISISNIFAEMQSLYHGNELPPAISFEPFLEEVMVQNDKAAIEFWASQVSDFQAHPLPLSSNAASQEEKTYVRSIGLSPADLEAFSGRHASTSLAVFQAAWVKTLSCAQNISDVCFGNVVSGRSVPILDVDRLVAPCFNTIPVRTKLGSIRTNLDLIRHLHRTNIECSPYQLTALRRIQALTVNPASRLFDSLLLLQPPHADAELWDVEEDSMDMGFPMVVEITPGDNDFELQLHYLVDHISDALVPIVVDAFIGSLIACVKYPSSSIQHFEDFDTVELAALLAPTAPKLAKTTDEPRTGVITEPWTREEELVREAFSNLARVDSSRITKETSLYQIGLDSLNAVQIASQLRKQGAHIDAADVMQHQTPSALAAFLISKDKDTQQYTDCIDLSSIQERERGHLVQSLKLDDHLLESIRPCTPTQSGMLAQFIQSHGSYYFNLSVYEIPANITFEQVRCAWAVVQQKHQVLRMGFAQLDNADMPFVMLIYRPGSYLKQIDLDTEHLGNAEAKRMANEQVFKNLHLPAWRLSFSTSAGIRSMRISLHHALYDADSLQVLLSDFRKALEGTSLGPAQDLDALLKVQLEGALQRKAESEAFWTSALQRSHLTKFPNLTPTIVEKSQLRSSQISLSSDLSALESFCQEHAVTMQALGQTAWALLLAGYFGEPDVTFGTVFAGSSGGSAQSIAFPTISTIPVYCDTQKSFIDVIQDMVSYNASAQRHRFSSLSEIQRYAGSTGHALFDTIFVYQKAAETNATTFDWKSLNDSLAVDYAVSMELEQAASGKLQLRLTYDDRTVPESHANIILQQYDVLIRRITDSFAGDYHEQTHLLSVVPAKEHTLPCGVNLLHEFVERGAREHPNKPALEFIYSLENTQKSRKTWSYRELDARSNQVAQLIHQHGIAPGSTIAICMAKCPEATFACVGILKAGCAFLAMDPDLPLARRQFIIEDSQSQLLFVDTSKASEGLVESVSVIELKESALADLSTSPVAIPAISPQSTSYCLYTSGTTGNPKGCELTHENAVQAMMAFQRLFADHWTESSRWLQFASYWFDVSVLEQFWSWSVGITVAGAPRDVVLEDLPGFIRAANITHIDLTPSLARLLKPEDVPSLHNHVFITGGEALKQEIIDSWGPLNTIYNGYGPTEATIGVTMNPHIGADAKPSNIGPPFDNVGAYVFAPGTDEVVMRGAVGELCVSGKLVGKGYLNRPDLTAKAFPYLERHGERVYRTGDLVRLLADNSVSFIGRQDTQAKLRGQRLEIDEIDAVIKQSDPKVADVASLVVKAGEGDREMLVSFVVASDARSRTLNIVKSQSAVELINSADRACRDHLPGYMVPTHMIPVTRVPLTVNNKVDAKSLVALFSSMSTRDLQELKGSQSESRALTSAERRVVKVLARLLSIDSAEITPASNIFSLGLSSVSAINLASMLKRSGFDNASVATVMNHQTVDRLASALQDQTGASQEERSAVMQAQLSISAFAQRHRGTAAKALRVNVSEIETMAPCTPLQEGILVESLKSSRKPYFNQFRYELGDVSIPRLEEAIRRLYSSLSILRTAFLYTDDGFSQVVLRRRSCPITVITLKNEEIDRYLDASLAKWRDQAKQDVESPFQVHIVQTPSRSVLSLFAHHALYDGISWDMMMNRLEDVHNTEAMTDCGPNFLEALPYGPLCRRTDAKQFWQGRLDGFHYAPLLPFCDSPPENAVHIQRKLAQFSFLESGRRRMGVSHQAILQAAFTVALHQMAPQTQTYGVVLSGRSIGFEKAEQVIGPMFNTVPFVIDVQAQDTWEQYLQRCHQSNSASLPFQHTPLREIRKFCGRNPGDPLFDVLFVFQRPEDEGSAASAIFKPIESVTEAEFPLAFEVELNRSDEITVTVAAQRGYASQSSLEQLLALFEKALKSILEGSQRLITEDFSVSRTSAISTPQTATHDVTMLDGVVDFEWSKDALKLREIISQVVGCDEDSVTEHVAIYTLGLDSIDAVKLASRMKRAGLAIPVSKLLQAQTIPRILDAIEDREAMPVVGSQSVLSSLEKQLQAFVPQAQTDDIERFLPATPGQEALVADMIRSGFRDYYNSDILKLRKDVDLEKLKTAWQTVVDASPILRTSFIEIEDVQVDSVYAQAVHKVHDLVFDEISAQDMTAVNEYIHHVRDDVRATLASRSPLRLAIANIAEERYLILSLSHAQYDGHSLALLHQDINRAYQGSFQPRPPYDEVIESALTSVNDESRTFWRNALSGAQPSLFPTQVDGAAGPSPNPTTHQASLPSSLPLPSARKACQHLGISLQALAQTAWTLLLAHHLRHLDVVFGVVLACRDTEDAEQIFFPTMNTAPMRSSIHGSASAMLKSVQSSIHEIRQFQRTPLRAVRAACGEALFDTLFVFQSRGDGQEEEEEEGVVLYDSVGGDANVEYPVAVEVEALRDELVIRASCKSTVLDQRGTESLVEGFDRVLEFLVRFPSKPVVEILRDDDNEEEVVSICGLSSFPIPNAVRVEEEEDAALDHTEHLSEDESEAESSSSEINLIRTTLAHVAKLSLHEITPSTTLDSVGIDSISAIKFSALLRKNTSLQSNLSVSEILKAQTPKRMAEVLRTREGQRGAEDDDDLRTANAEASREFGFDFDFGADFDYEEVCRRIGVGRQDVEILLPVTAGQEYMLSLWRRSCGELFFARFRYRVKGFAGIGVDRLRRAWEELVKRNQVLRTVFVCAAKNSGSGSGSGEGGGGGEGSLSSPLVQVVLKEGCVKGSFFLCQDGEERGEGGGKTQPFVSLSVTENANATGSGTASFDLSLKIHHALYDAVSLPLLIRQLQDLANGIPPSEPEVRFDQYIALAHGASAQERRKEFWQSYLKGVRQPDLLPTTKPTHKSRKKIQIFHPAAFKACNDLEKCAKAARVTVQAILFAVYAKIVARPAFNSNSDEDEDIIIALYIANRTPLPSLEHLSAPTLNLLPLRVAKPRTTDLLQSARRIDQDLKILGLSENSGVSLREVYEWTGVRVGGGGGGAAGGCVNFLKVPGREEREHAMGEEEEGGGVEIEYIDDEWNSDDVVSRVVEIETESSESVERAMPAELKDFAPHEAYLDSVDVEFSISGAGELGVGVFAREDFLGLEEGEGVVRGVVEELERFVRGRGCEEKGE